MSEIVVMHGLTCTLYCSEWNDKICTDASILLYGTMWVVISKKYTKYV